MFKKNYFLFILTILIFASYILGFIINENSIGSGGYNGDLVWIWDNFEIFKSENIFSAIKSEDFFGNRTPLLYILNFYFNPFIEDIYTYRLSIFIFSILVFCVYYLCLKTKFKNLNLETALFLSSVILLSPFYRTSSFWGLEIQYGIISALLSFYFFKKNEKIESANYKNIFLTILFSSATVYFDVKLVFVPLLIFFKYLTAKIEIEKKIIILFLYFIFAIPYFLLIFMWSGLVPKATQVGNPLQGTHLGNSNIHLVNLLFATNILGFYLFPILIFKKKLISDIKKIPNLFNLFLLIIFCLYLFYFINYNLFDYTDVFTKQEGGYKNLYGLISQNS